MKRFAQWVLATVRRGGWAPIAVFATHIIGSKVFSVYERLPGFDIPMHLAGGAAIAHFVHVASILGSERGLLGAWHRLTHGLLVFGWTAVAAVVWEFSEFSSDRLFGTQMQAGSLDDTLKDILLGLVGGAAVTLWACGFSQSAEPPTASPEADPRAAP